MLRTITRITKQLSSKINSKRTLNHNRQIIALGGGGFSSELENPLLDEYILKQTGKIKPRILFLPTAGIDHENYIRKFYDFYNYINCIPIHLSLTKEKRSYRKLEEIILKQDVIFVGGGSPYFLMREWRKHGMDKMLRKAYKFGIVLSGMSAGAICWFADGFRNPRDDYYYRIKCMGLLEGSFCPHYDSNQDLRRQYKRMVSQHTLDKGYGVEDGVALHFINEELKFTVSSNTNSKMYAVSKSGFRLTEKIIKPIYLGKKKETLRNELRKKNSAAENKTIQIVKEFVLKINSHNLDGLIEMITDDHTFTDSMGIDISGKRSMLKAWDIYLTMFPDYKIAAEEWIIQNDHVAIFGTATGTLATNGRLSKENSFEIPASWTAVVRDGKIAEWRVYADNQPVREIISRYQKIYS